MLINHACFDAYLLLLPCSSIDVCRAQLMGREMVIGDGVAELTKLQDSGVVLTSRSLQVRVV